MLTNHNKKKRQVEASTTDSQGTTVKLIVGLNGYDYKHYTRDHKWHPTTKFNVHLSLNGPLQLTFHEAEELLDELAYQIARAKSELIAEEEKS